MEGPLHNHDKKQLMPLPRMFQKLKCGSNSQDRIPRVYISTLSNAVYSTLFMLMQSFSSHTQPREGGSGCDPGWSPNMEDILSQHWHIGGACRGDFCQWSESSCYYICVVGANLMEGLESLIDRLPDFTIVVCLPDCWTLEAPDCSTWLVLQTKMAGLCC